MYILTWIWLSVWILRVYVYLYINKQTQWTHWCNYCEVLVRIQFNNECMLKYSQRHRIPPCIGECPGLPGMDAVPALIVLEVIDLHEARHICCPACNYGADLRGKRHSVPWIIWTNPMDQLQYMAADNSLRPSDEYIRGAKPLFEPMLGYC